VPVQRQAAHAAAQRVIGCRQQVERRPEIRQAERRAPHGKARRWMGQKLLEQRIGFELA
jgi:hypothetical protein